MNNKTDFPNRMICGKVKKIMDDRCVVQTTIAGNSVAELKLETVVSLSEADELPALKVGDTVRMFGTTLIDKHGPFLKAATVVVEKENAPVQTAS